VNIALMEGGKPLAGVIHAPIKGTTWFGSKGTGAWKMDGKSFTRLPFQTSRKSIEEIKGMRRPRVILSRSHLSDETMHFLEHFTEPQLISLGSSLKFMLLAEAAADIYPRLGTTMEWDTAAAHAILGAVNKGIYQLGFTSELRYNKDDLRNPFFIAF
jgi:3'(2'), 5'-bisphosphate nucleotidase